MADNRLGGVLHHLRRTVLRPDGIERSDGQLVESFLARRDEAAFETLVRRHGPMVLGVCRRILNNPHDAEDAFQAVFLVLVRRAASIRPREQVGNWLYGVAYRTALEARRTIARWHRREKQVHPMPDQLAPVSEVCPDLRPMLDAELNRLPDKYRTPVVLCDLEGRGRHEVAQMLRIPEGTLSSRLATARRMLARRLARHGLAVSAATMGTFLAEQASAAAVPATLIASTRQAALLFAGGTAIAAGAASTHVLLLTEGVLKAMFLTKLKTMTAVCLLMVLMGGGLGLVGRGASADPATDGTAAQAKKADPKKAGTPGKQEAVQNKDVERKLNAMMKVDLKDSTLEEFIANLRVEAGLNLLIDKQALNNAGIALDQPVTLSLENVQRKTALKHILRSAGLTYTIEDGILIVTAPQSSRAKVLRVYPVWDLVQREPIEKKDGTLHPPELVRIVTRSVEPESWRIPEVLNHPGSGTIEYFHDGRSLVISNTSDVHDQIQVLLEDLRKAMNSRNEIVLPRQ